MHTRIDKILEETNWALYAVIDDEISKEDEEYITNYFQNINDDDLNELVFLSKVRDDNWLEGLNTFLFCDLNLNHIDYDRFISGLLDGFQDSIKRDREYVVVSKFLSMVSSYFYYHAKRSRKHIIDYINIFFNFLVSKTIDSYRKEMYIYPNFESRKYSHLMFYYNYDYYENFCSSKSKSDEIIFANNQLDIEMQEKTTKEFINKNLKYYTKDILKMDNGEKIIEQICIPDRNFYFNISDSLFQNFRETDITKNNLKCTVNSNVISAQIKKLYTHNFHNINLVELYNLSNIELDFDREDLKKYYFIKPMVVHSSLAEKSVITKHNNFVFAYVNNKGYLIGYEGNDKEVILPSRFKYEKIKVKEYEIREHTCDYQTNTERLVIPKNITKLGINIFFNQMNLKELILKCNKVEVIPNFAFACCGNLKRIYLPRSIKRIEEFAFASCRSLKDIYYEGTKEEWNQIEIIKSKSIYNKDEFGKAEVHFNSKVKDLRSIHEK